MNRKTSKFLKNVFLSKNLRMIGLVFSVVFVSVLSSTAVSAVAKQSSITIEIDTNAVSATVEPNKFAESNTQTINVRTDNFTGYTLSIASSDSRNLEDGSGNEIETINTTISESEFTNNDNYINKWGYKPSQYIMSGSSGNTTVINTGSFLPAPSTLGDTLDITDAANNSNKTYNISFGVKVDRNTVPGSYTSSAVIRALANDVGYVLTYNKNTEDDVSDMPYPNPEESTIAGGVDESDSFILLSSSVPTRTGFTFTGWCDEETTEDVSTKTQTCPGTLYAAEDELPIDQTSDNTNLEIFAVWEANVYDVTIATTTGVSSVAIRYNNTDVCVASNATGTTCRLTYGVEYELIATIATGYSFNEWSNDTGKGTIGNYSSASTTFTTGDGVTALAPSVTINSYTQTTEVRYQNADGTWGNYSTVETASINYGSSYSWSTSKITNFNSTIYKAASVATYTVTGVKTNQVSIYRNTFACSKRYRLQNADGTWGNYVSDGSVTALYGGSCSYSKTVTDYKGSSSAANGAAGSASASNVTAAQTLSINFYRNTYALTVNRNTTAISAATGTGTYRWGQSISISATAVSGYHFTAWSQTAGTTSSFGSTTTASTTFVMPKSAATIYANGAKTYLQDLSLSDCTTTAMVAYDKRDDEQYKIQKLSDGKCWMLDNLRLDPVSVTLANLKGNTHASDTIITYLKNGGGSGTYASSGVVRNANIGGSSLDFYTKPAVYVENKNTTTTGYGAGSKKRGVYYNFCAATAGSFCEEESHGASDHASSADLCPSGWYMPTGGSDGRYKATCNVFNGSSCADSTSMTATNTGSLQYNVSLTLSGYLNDSFRRVGSEGYFWSKTYFGDSANVLRITPTMVYSTASASRKNGLPMRCIMSVQDSK